MSRVFLFVLLLPLLVGAPAAADDRVVGLQAAQLARAGRCAEAIDLVAGVASPSAELLLIRGRCEIELKRWPAAVGSLDQAYALDPALDGVALQLAVARFHQGDRSGARTALAEAQAAGAEGAEFELYRGLLLLEDAQSGAAAQALERAAALDPRMDLTASYYAGLAWAGAQDRAKAEEALNRVIEMAPGTTWADEAQIALDQLGEGGPSWWAWVKAGMEYDNNVVLRSNGSQLPEDISGDSDVRGVWELHTGSELFRTSEWAGGASLDYYGSAHIDLNEFDQHFPIAGGWLDRRLAETTTLRLRYDIGYGWVDYSPYLFTHGLTATLFHDWGSPGRSRIYGRPYWDDFLFSKDDDVPDGRGVPFSPCTSRSDIVCGPPGIDERDSRNRDGFGFMAGIEHDYPIQALETELTFGYRFDHFDADGADFSYNAHEWLIQTRSSLPWDLLLIFQARYWYRPYENSSSFPEASDLFLNREYPLAESRRRDSGWGTQIDLEKRWSNRFSTSIRWSYFNQDSSVRVFSYDRQIVGIYATYRFGR